MTQQTKLEILHAYKVHERNIRKRNEVLAERLHALLLTNLTL
jgi:hypothetical protein